MEQGALGRVVESFTSRSMIGVRSGIASSWAIFGREVTRDSPEFPSGRRSTRRNPKPVDRPTRIEEFPAR